MKKFWVMVCLCVMCLIPAVVSAQCLTIQDGNLFTNPNSGASEPVSTGYDQWGYNYQAHMFNGTYCDSKRGTDPSCTDESELQMKWNDAWLSNKDCDNDGKLDRHFGSDSYLGSEAWLTNHQSGWVADANGKKRKWTYSCKIIAAPEGAYVANGDFYDASDVKLGTAIWGQFIITQEVSNDPSNGAHGILYKAPVGPGLGNN
jgi:hypothetical protein